MTRAPQNTNGPTAGLPREYPVRGFLILGLLTLLLLLGGFGFWSANTRIAGAVVTHGQIEVDLHRQVVQHPDGGVVAEILVQEGDFVEQGALLIRLEPILLATEHRAISNQRLELYARKARFEAERDDRDTVVFSPTLFDTASDNPAVQALMNSQERLFHARLETLEHELDQLNKRREQILIQITGIAAQNDSLSRQIALIGEELEAQQILLERGLAQSARVLSLQREEARLLGQIGEISAAETQAREKITEVDLQQLTFMHRRREEAIAGLNDQRPNLVQAEARIQILEEQMYRLDIRAPVSGIVHGMRVFSRLSVIRPAEEILSLIPQNRPLVINVNIEPIHIDQVYVGQETTLRFPAFDSRDTPELLGKVARVSADSFSDEASGTSFYRAEITLNPGEAERLPPNRVLLPGMPVEAYIRTTDRTPLTWLVKPLADYFNRAFREGT